MDQLELAKIQNTINEIKNQLNKELIDTSVSKILMQRASMQLNQLITRIGYLQAKSKDNLISTEPTLIVDEDWNIDFSHGPQANYLVQGEAIQMLVDHIKYMHVLIENCPGTKHE